MTDDKLFHEMSAMLDKHPVDEVIPLLITASARSLVIDANGDVDKLGEIYVKFCRILQSQMFDMLHEDLEESARSTKQ